MSPEQRQEWAAVADQFGADLEQVRRTHLADPHLADARLSEDIDLLTLTARSHVAQQIETAVRAGLARTHGRPTWRPPLTTTTGSQPATLILADAPAIQVQLVTDHSFAWPTEIADLEQRYSDAPPARLRILTAAGFAAAKLSAWMERHAPRDLYTCGPWPGASSSTTPPSTSSSATAPPDIPHPRGPSVPHRQNPPGATHSPTRPACTSPPPKHSPAPMARGTPSARDPDRVTRP